jgi:hypothetical protein
VKFSSLREPRSLALPPHDLVALFRAAPAQRPRGFVIAALEQFGADRLRQGWIV